MDVPLHWYVLAVVTTLLNGVTFGFVAWRESNTVLRRWALAWLAWGLAAIPLAALGAHARSSLIAVACGLLWVASTLHFIAGAYGFAARPVPRAWYGVGVACAVTALALGVGPNGAAGMVPLVLFQSVGLCGTGVILIRRARERAGAWFCGVAFVSLGVHVLDAPVLATHPSLFLWGFVLAIVLQVVAALGMLMLHYEHARAELTETQRAVEEHRRIEALGRIAGGVAHDFNNMLTVMQGQLELIRLRGTPAGELQSSLVAMEEAVRRAGRLTSQLLAFGRRSVLQPQSIDVREAVSGTLDLLRKVVPESIELRLECGDGPFVASMDQSLLEQIVLNLVINARDAIAGQGHILVELQGSALPEPAVCLRVTDDGVGMDESVITRIFEPFFTSKATGRGTGLGLASVQGAVTQLGGRIAVRSQLGHGSCFEVVLPWIEARVAPAAPEQPRVERTASILVVDDDDGVRQVTAKMLELGGHRVEQARDGAVALAMVQGKAYDLVISDVVMPHMGGLDLFVAIGKLRPSTALLLTSGYPLDGGPTPECELLTKPFRQSGLLDSVARLLAKRERGQSAQGAA